MQTPSIEVRDGTAVAHGDWVLAALPRDLTVAAPAGARSLDASGVTTLDTAGALALSRVAAALGVEPGGLDDAFAALYRQVAELARVEPAPPPPHHGVLYRIGATTVTALDDARRFLAFIGELALVAVHAVRNPRRFRWRAILHVFETAGWGALPILALLSFLIGVVVAYQAGVQLRAYGADIFIADLIGIAVVREFGPLLAAIIVAGRTGSAFTAEIGTMKVTDEIDALTTTGVSPLEMLALPKLLALVVVLPLLTVFADALGVFGGIVMAQHMLEVGLYDFVDRLRVAVDLSDLLTGLGKAPVFALLIASVGCYQGFQVRGSADSVGRHVTRSVVHSLFLIIVADAAFSIVFERLDL